MFLLDTNVVSEARKAPRRRDSRFDAWMRSVRVVDAYLSVIVVGEVLAGVIRAERKDPAQGRDLRRWLDDDLLPSFQGRILDVTHAVAEREALLQVPDPRPKADALIAATGLTHGLTVVTRNTSDFEGMGVSLVDPWS